jgi:hypothetical protein
MLNNAVEIGTTVLADMLISIAEHPSHIGWQLWKKSDDFTAISPASEDDNISLVHLSSPRLAG